MRNKLNRKQLVVKRIQHRHNEVKFLEKLEKKPEMNERDRRRIEPISIPVETVIINHRIDRDKRRTENKTDISDCGNIDYNNLIVKEFNYFGKYIKQENVDFDVIICISSFNRYNKINLILEQLFNQKTKYNFKIIFFNDGSTEEKYEEIKYKYPDIIYLKNEKNSGKVNYWKTVNNMWKKAKEFKTHTILQLDDDFILCDNFLDILLDKFFEIKELDNSYMVYSFHLYNFSKTEPIDEIWFDENYINIDGGILFDSQFMNYINYELDLIELRVKNNSQSSFTWTRIREKIIEFKCRIFRFKNSLVWHNGNDDSKLHPNVRKIKRIYTKNFIDIKKIEEYEQYD